VFDFARRSALVFNRPHSVRDELAWLDSEGPTSPALVGALTAEQARFDWIVVFSYRYHHAFHSVRAVASKAVLVPTAERDAAVGLSIFGPIFRGVRALMFNSHEERAMLQHASGRDLPGVVVGVGSDVPERPNPTVFDRNTAWRARLRSTWDASTRTRAARSSSSSSSASSAACRASSSWCSSALRSCRYPTTLVSAISGSFPMRTSSTRWRPPTC
jgi:hypothetical protein